ncbi:hypothetical protein Lal_00014093 [Lupinus albus]|nr:hypothetical protein Lal_00014093 [Lupinus albus]
MVLNVLYGTESWKVKCQQENRLHVVEMRIEKVGVAPIVENMGESRLRWFGHVWRRPVEVLVRKSVQIEASSIPRGREWPRKIIGEMIKKDVELNALSIHMIYDRALYDVVRSMYLTPPSINQKLKYAAKYKTVSGNKSAANPD